MRISGITLPDNKRMEIALTAVYGIGRKKALTLLETAKVSADKRPTELTTDEEAKVRELVEAQVIEGDLKRSVSANVKRLKDIKAYRGSRHARKLPVKGQRTKSNSRTVRGNVRKTMGSGKTKVEKK